MVCIRLLPGSRVLSLTQCSRFLVSGTLQMLFQLAHYRMYGHSGEPWQSSMSGAYFDVPFFSASTYESANTSAFKHGRTETIRSATMDRYLICANAVWPTVRLKEMSPAATLSVRPSVLMV